MSTADIDAIVGADRKEKLILHAAGRAVAEFGMDAKKAIRYKRQTWPDPTILVAAGQVWADARGMCPERRTVVGVHRESGMVELEGGSGINLGIFARDYRLVEWWEGFNVDVDEDDEDDEEDEERFDPSQMVVLIQREGQVSAPIKARIAGAAPSHVCYYLGMPAQHYTSTPWPNCQCHTVTLDVPAYLAAGLWDFRDGWAEYQAQWKPGNVWLVFNEIDEPYESPAVVGGYLNTWLWDRIRADVVREHGGTGDDYTVMFLFGGHSADAIIEAYPYADPRVDLPADHDLMQCSGQGNLLELLDGAS